MTPFQDLFDLAAGRKGGAAAPSSLLCEKARQRRAEPPAAADDERNFRSGHTHAPQFAVQLYSLRT